MISKVYNLILSQTGNDFPVFNYFPDFPQICFLTLSLSLTHLNYFFGSSMALRPVLAATIVGLALGFSPSIRKVRASNGEFRRGCAASRSVEETGLPFRPSSAPFRSSLTFLSSSERFNINNPRHRLFSHAHTHTHALTHSLTAYSHLSMPPPTTIPPPQA